MCWKSFFLATILLLFNISLNATVECNARLSVADEFKRVSAVFAGEAVAEEYRDITFGKEAGAKVLVVKFKVEKWWKGGETEEVYLYTSIRKFPDGSTRKFGENFHFNKGESYLVYAYDFEDKLRTSQCRRTKTLAKAEEDMRELGEGSEPTKK